MRPPFLLLLLCLFSLALPAAGAEATTFNVSTTADSNSGTCAPGACTLRQAVEAANTASGPDEVSVPSGTYPLVFGQLISTADLTLSGAGSGSVAIVSNGSARVIANPVTGVSLRIEGVTISGGRVKGTSAGQAQGGGVFNAGRMELDHVVVSGNKVEPADLTGTSPQGGGVFNSGSLLITNSLIEENVSTARPFNGGIPAGGGVFNAQGGVLEVRDSQLLKNEAQTEVGGIPEGGGLGSEGTSPHGASATVTRTLLRENIAVGLGGTIPSGGAVSTYDSDLTIRESTVQANKAIAGTGGIAEAGGLYVASGGTFLLAESLVAGNVAESATVSDAGGILAIGEATDQQSIVNSTISGNQAVSPTSSHGGGILHSGNGKSTLQVLNATIFGNAAVSAGSATGGNVADNSSEGGATVLRNSIVAAGSGGEGANCEGAVKSAGHNIDSADECNFTEPGDKVNTDPRLDPLAGNGGPTETMALRPDSPAIDAGGEPCPATDQRGIARPQGPACDIGAYEVFVPKPPAAAPSGPAKLRLLSKRVAVGPKTGKGRLRASCLNVPGDICSVTFRLWWSPAGSPSKAKASKRRRAKVGTVTGVIAGGKSGALRVKLNKRGRALLASSPRAKLAVKAAGKSRNRSSEATQVKAKLLLKLKSKRRH